jgi:hypothetical protein
MPNNSDPVPTSVNLSSHQLITTTANIPPTINAPAFSDIEEEFFWVFKLEFLVKNSENFYSSPLFSVEGWNPQDALHEVSQA